MRAGPHLRYMPLKKRSVKQPTKRIGFYVELPRATIREIKRRTSKTKPQWMVVDEAVNGITVAKGSMQMIVMPGRTPVELGKWSIKLKPKKRARK